MKLRSAILFTALSALLVALPAFAQRGGGHGGGGGGARGGGFSGGGARSGGGFSSGHSGGGFSTGGFRNGGVTGGNFSGGFRGNSGGFRGSVGGGNRGGGFVNGYSGNGYRGGYRGGYYGGSRLIVGFGGAPYYYGGYPYYGGYGYYGSYPYNSYSSYAYGSNGCDPYYYDCGGYTNYGTYGSSPTYISTPAQPTYIQQNYSTAPAAPQISYPPAANSTTATGQTDFYLIAFTDHTIQAVLDFRLDGDTFFYTTREHVEKQAPLSAIDRRFSEQINRDRRVEIRLP